jgi:hypothetical protein
MRRAGRGDSFRKRQFDDLRKVNYASPSIPPVTRGRAARLCRRKKKRLSRNIFPDHYPNQDINFDFLNIYIISLSAAPNINIDLPIVDIFNFNTIKSHAVYILYFRLNNLY